MYAHVPSHLHKYKQVPIVKQRTVRIHHYFNTLIKKQGTLQNGRHFHEFCAGNGREAAWKIITKGIHRYLSNYSKSPCYRRDKTVYACDKKPERLAQYRTHTPFSVLGENFLVVGSKNAVSPKVLKTS